MTVTAKPRSIDDAADAAAQARCERCHLHPTPPCPTCPAKAGRPVYRDARLEADPVLLRNARAAWLLVRCQESHPAYPAMHAESCAAADELAERWRQP